MRTKVLIAFIIVILIFIARMNLITTTPYHANVITAPSFPLVITCASSHSNMAGAEVAEICVHTEPSAQLSIEVTYCSGHPAMSQELQGVVETDTQGGYQWMWYVQSQCKGEATAQVVARWQGIAEQVSASFVV